MNAKANLPAQTENKAPTLKQRLEQMTPEFKKALPGHIPVERFVRTVQTAVQMNPDIVKACGTQDGLHSLLAACTKAATDGLILDGREAALVPFSGKVQYMPMVAGLMKKARNSGEIASIAAHVVYEKDKFTYILGDDERIEHAPALGDRGQPVAVYAIVKLKDGSVQREVMDKAAVMRIARQSKNPKQYDPAQGPNYGEWWRKTVIRRISKYLPSSSDRDEFMQAVERIDEGFDFEATNGGETVPAEPQPARKKRGGAAAALKQTAPTPQKNARQEAEDAEFSDIPHDRDTGEVFDQDNSEMYGDDSQQPDEDI